MSNTAEEAFEIFVKHWKARNPGLHLDDEQIREQIMALLSSVLVLLNSSPEAFQNFYKGAENVMIAVTPPSVIAEIMKVTDEPTN